MFDQDDDFNFDEEFLNGGFISSTCAINEDVTAQKSKIDTLRLDKTVSNVNPLKVPKVVKRKFPGPAGLLPEIEDFSINPKTLEDHELPTQSTEILCSQSSVKVFQNLPWQQMKADFKKEPVFLPNKYNISWIKTRAASKKLINQKAPFLAAVIETLDVVNTKLPCSVTLKDETGEIQGTISHKLYEEYHKHLTLNSVIILKQVGIFTQNTNHYVTITPNNLVTIYSSVKRKIITDLSSIGDTTETEQNESTLSKSLEPEEEEEVKVISVQTFDTNGFLQSLEEIKQKERLNSSKFQMHKQGSNANHANNHMNSIVNKQIVASKQFNSSSVNIKCNFTSIKPTNGQVLPNSNNQIHLQINHQINTAKNTDIPKNATSERGQNKFNFKALLPSKSTSNDLKSIFDNEEDFNFHDIQESACSSTKRKRSPLAEKSNMNKEIVSVSVSKDWAESQAKMKRVETEAKNSENLIKSSQITIVNCDIKDREILEEELDGLDASFFLDDF